MKKLLLIIIITLSCNSFAISQDFKTHTVKEGETIESIARKYMVTPSDIYVLNPDAKKKLNPASVLIIPNSRVAGSIEKVETRELVGYESHRVRRKETLYSISKEYKIEIEDIKKHNKELYSENLKKGDKIRIPKYKTVVGNPVVSKSALKKYKVQAKEGKWGIAYKYGITVPELEALNPNMGEMLQPDQELNVPNLELKEEKLIETSYNYYQVLPKEGFYRLKVKLGLTQEQLEKLNPELVGQELKDGMILKVPGNVTVGTIDGDIVVSNLTKSLKNLKTKRIALMLPFKLYKIDVDSVAEAKDIIKGDRLVSVSLDFHSGVLMALDSAKQLGISTNLKVFDTRNQISEVSKILDKNDLSSYDAVIGPLLAANFDRVASQLKIDKIPAVSPMMIPTSLYDNVFQTIPSEEMMRQSLIRFIQKDSTNRSIVIISDASNRTISDRLKTDFPAAKQIFSRKDKNGKDAYYINANELTNAFRNGKNYVFLETANAGMVLNVTSLLNGMASNRSKELILVTTNKTDAFENEHVSNFHLSNLKFHYPSINRTFNSEISNGFVKQYKKVYGYEPNKYAVRGFDLTLDILLRLASEDDLYKASSNDVETEYLENKFRYSKKLYGGFFNESVYILQYNDLTIEEAKQ